MDIKDIKYLDRDEVEKIILSHGCMGCSGGLEKFAISIYEDLPEIVNAILSLAIPEVKYLDRDEVEKIFDEYIDSFIDSINYCTDIRPKDIAIDKILSLAINRDKILNILKGYTTFKAYVGKMIYITPETITDEIIGNSGRSMTKEELAKEKQYEKEHYPECVLVNRDKIIEVLKRYITAACDNNGNPINIHEIIADEIVGKDK